jgi:hypothetical protein
MELTEQPREFNFSGNQIRFAISENIVVNSGDAGISWLFILSTPPLGSRLTFKFNARVISLNVVSDVAHTNDPFGTIPHKPSMTAFEYRDLLVGILQGHPSFANYFEILGAFDSYGGPVVSLRAWNPGPEFDLEQMDYGKDDDGNVDANYNWRAFSMFFGGNDPELLPVTHILELFFENDYNSGAFSKLGEFSGTTNNDGEIVWDLKSNLEAALVDSSPKFLPEWNPSSTPYLTQLRKIDALVRRFRVLLRDETPPAEQLFSYAVYNGGVKKEHWPVLKDWPTWQEANARFLTWKPDQIEITRSQPEILYLLRTAELGADQLVDYGHGGSWIQGDGDIKVKARVFYSDETSEDLTPYQDTQSPKWSVLEIPVGFKALGLDAKEVGKTILFYEVWATISIHDPELGGLLEKNFAGPRRYVLTDEKFHDRFFFFKNSFNVFETLRTEGHFVPTFRTEKNVIRKDLSSDYVQSDGERKVYRVNTKEPTKVHIAVQSQDEQVWIRELFRSPEVYFIDGSDLYQVFIEPGSFELPQDDQYLFINQFTFTWMNDNEFFSKL